MNGKLYQKLSEYGESDFYPFHMPGHKRSSQCGSLSEIFRIDITEIDGFDNLHQPEGLIKEAQERAARLYGAKNTFFLVNGSTCGILSAVSAIAEKNKILIMARNCHKSAFHAAILNQMPVRYIYPEYLAEYDINGEVTEATVRNQIMKILSETGTLKEKASDIIAGIILTSPTYEGICSDIEAIAQTVHAFGLPLLVDEAHGAHLGFHPAYPENAVHQGADIVVQSVHKTLPAPTQTALLHVDETRVTLERVKTYLHIYQTSSPSYILMAGIDSAMELLEREGAERLWQLRNMREKFCLQVKGCKHIRIVPGTEPSKLVISVKNTNLSGKQLYDILREKHHLQLEMAMDSYVLAMLSIMDRPEGLDRLATALLMIDKQIQPVKPDVQPVLPVSERKAGMEMFEALFEDREELQLEDAEGRLSAEFVNVYPPGIPILTPGEVIDQEVSEIVKGYLNKGLHVQGLFHHKIRVINRKELQV